MVLTTFDKRWSALVHAVGELGTHQDDNGSSASCNQLSLTELNDNKGIKMIRGLKISIVSFAHGVEVS